MTLEEFLKNRNGEIDFAHQEALTKRVNAKAARRLGLQVVRVFCNVENCGTDCPHKDHAPSHGAAHPFRETGIWWWVLLEDGFAVGLNEARHINFPTKRWGDK